MKKSDALRKEAELRDMVEGTGLEWWKCVKYLGRHGNVEWYFDAPDDHYAFALAVVEGKPVFPSDLLWFNGYPAAQRADASWLNPTSAQRASWNPLKPKTITVELTVEDAKIWAGCTGLSGYPEVNSRLYAACAKSFKESK